MVTHRARASATTPTSPIETPFNSSGGRPGEAEGEAVDGAGHRLARLPQGDVDAVDPVEAGVLEVEPDAAEPRGIAEGDAVAADR